MSIFVTSTGFNKKTYADHKTYYENLFTTVFGNDIDLDDSGGFGQLVAQLALRDTNIWEGAEEIYNSRNPNSATGISLDNICAETGVIRQLETSTTVNDVFLFADTDITITAGSLIKITSNNYEFALLNDVLVTSTNLRYIQLKCENPGGTGETYTIILDGDSYSYDSLAGDDGVDIATALYNLLVAGSFAGTITRTDEFLEIQYTSIDFSIVYTGNLTLESRASGGIFECTTPGVIAANANTLTSIVTPISGWLAVNNPVAGILGRETETDTELRIRRSSTLLLGNATEEAIKNNLLNNVSGITAITVVSNRDSITVDGLPPKSFECIISGGVDSDIASEILRTEPAGIESYGNVTEIVIDSQGTPQTIKFSRPTAKYAHVKIQREFYSEEDYPVDGDTQIKDSIVAWALTNQGIGKDIIRQRLSIPVYQIPGVGDIAIWLDVTDNPGDTPTYVQTDFAIAVREYADFAVSRIVVEALP